MFANIAKFFIKNSKLTIVLVLIIFISGIWSYFILPKQYNPTIVVPAFNVFVKANGLSSNESSKYIVSPLENKLMEIEWIDKVYWIAGDNYWSVMVQFNVWEDLEKAKIKINQKLIENMDLSPIWASNPIIKTINPEELPQITFAITYKWDFITKEQEYIYLRQVANIIKEKLKTVKNTSTIDIVWGYANDIIIDLDLSLVESKNTDLMHIYSTLKENNINMWVWSINSWIENINLSINSRIEDIDQLKKIVIWNFWGNVLYLEDVSEIRYWIKDIDTYSTYNWKYSVLLWVGKSVWTNSVIVTDDVLNKIEEIKKDIPNNIDIITIQNEWKTARDATNMLLVNLAQSILIVFFVLALYLWKKDAFNTAFSIPLTLWLVFFIALILWENINRITLFALILVLWMLVDNSTVVVENISRHLNERINTWKTKLESVLEGVQEVWMWVILSTLSRLLAFWAMFAVWGMMWEYMWPIPKFAIIALLISLLIAFTINPWLSYSWAREVTESDRSNNKQNTSKYDIRRYYLSFMKKFLNNDKKSKAKRKIFKFTFWLSLFIIIIAPIYLGIFKARMLPKSNQNQIYLWIDAPRGWSSDKMKEVEEDLKWFFNETKLPKELFIVDNISTTIGQAFMWDFANLFRWWVSRVWENQISSRINLTSPDVFKEKTWNDRIISENYAIQIRPYLRDYMLTKYPDLQLRLLEDPPGPPVRATFLLKIKSDSTLENKRIFLDKVKKEVLKISNKYSLVDIWDSISTTYRKININLDNELVTRSWLTSSQVANTIAISLNWIDINLIWSSDSIEATNLILWVKKDQINKLDFLKNISFTNNLGNKIYLSSISDIDYDFVWEEINTDKREEVDYIYAEMWDNSLVYPAIKLFWILMDDNFLWDDYEVIWWNPYWIEYKSLNDSKIYKLEWWWEWELTIDTFKDLWLAMIISLLAIYFLLVWQFSSFRVAWIIMITFLLSFFWVFPWFTVLYLLKNEYFSATSMIWIIALWWIVVWNAIILIDYLNVLKRNWLTIIDALLKAWYVRFAPIILTSLTTVFWAATIVWDPVWSWLAWAIIWWLLVSSILTLIVIPIFYYDSQKDEWEKCAWIPDKKCK